VVNQQETIRLVNRYFHIFDEIIIDDDGLINSSATVKMKEPYALGRLPVRFGRVHNFIAVGQSLQTLHGSPHTVDEDFDVDHNPLGDNGLQGGPQQVVGNYWCNHCSLTTLAGAPRKVGSFYCSYNRLQNLKGAPEEVDEDFFCTDNPLKSLEGLPARIPGELRLTYDENVPLLRTLGAELVTFSNWHTGSEAEKVQEILQEYQGQGKRGVIRCQKDLIKAGYEGNARW
jgi:hypothetical protein